MKCFNHRETDAIAICKYCQKGLCSNCIVDTPYGITCHGRCESEITDLYAMIQQNKKDRVTNLNLISTTSRTYAQTAMWSLLIGFLFLITSLFLQGITSILVGLFGVAYLLGAAFNYWSSRKFKSK